MPRTTGPKIRGPSPPKFRGKVRGEVLELKNYDGNAQRNLGYVSGGLIRVSTGGNWKEKPFRSKVKLKKGDLILGDDMGDFVQFTEKVGHKYY